MLVLYVGSLASLFLTSLYRLNEDGSGIDKVIGAQNYRTLLDKSVYLDIAVRTIKIAVLVTLLDIVLALPDRVLHRQGRRRRAGAGCWSPRCSCRCGPRTW